MDSSLRRIVEQDSKCQSLFDEALALSNGIAANAMGKWAIVPYFTDHSPKHLAAVEEILNRMIFAGPSDRAMFIPNPEEAMYLLSAVWLHDIGMYYGILPRESPEIGDVAWIRIRDEHELRSAQYIQNEWQFNCSWSDEQKAYLSAVCMYHRRKHALDRFKPAVVREGSDRPVRLLELAALLRLADACHIDGSRSPADLRALFMSVKMPSESRVHWQLPMQVTGVDFDHGAHAIRPRFLLPRGRKRGTIDIDYSPVAESIKQHLLEELNTVVDSLGRYSNVGFRFVTPELIQENYIIEKDTLLPSIWPLLLKCVVSPSEAASLVAALVLVSVREQRDLPRRDIQEIIDRAKQQQPYNVLLLRLARDVEKSMLDESSSTASAMVVKCKEEYLRRRLDACEAVAQSAATEIKNNDTIIISAYSHNVITFIRRRKYHEGRVLVVRADETQPEPIGSAGYRRILRELESDRIPFVAVDLFTLPQVLRSIISSSSSQAWYLPGCYGVIDGEFVLAPPGSEAVAIISKRCGARVAILAETEKIAFGDELSKTLGETIKESYSEVKVSDQELVYIRLHPALDVLEKTEFDMILGPPETVNDSLDRQHP